MSLRFTSKVFVSRVPVALFTSSSPITNNIDNHHDYYHYHHYIIGSVHFPLTYLLPVGFLQLDKKRSHKPEIVERDMRYDYESRILFLKRVILTGKKYLVYRHSWTAPPSLFWDVVQLNPIFLLQGRSLSSILSWR